MIRVPLVHLEIQEDLVVLVDLVMRDEWAPLDLLVLKVFQVILDHPDKE